MTAAELESAREQLKASIIFGLESSDTRLFRLFNEECYIGAFRDVREVLADIDRVDVDMIAEASKKILDPGALVRTVCGPGGNAGRNGRR